MKSNSILSAWKPSLPERTTAQGTAWPGTSLPPPTFPAPAPTVPNQGQSLAGHRLGRAAGPSPTHVARPRGSSGQLQCDTTGHIPQIQQMGWESHPSHQPCAFCCSTLSWVSGLVVAGRTKRDRAEGGRSGGEGGGELTDLPLSLKWQHIC